MRRKLVVIMHDIYHLATLALPPEQFACFSFFFLLLLSYITRPLHTMFRVNYSDYSLYPDRRLLYSDIICDLNWFGLGRGASGAGKRCVLE
jgi:hypothetical protein